MLIWVNKTGGLEITSCLVKDATIYFLKEIIFLYVPSISEALGEGSTLHSCLKFALPCVWTVANVLCES